MAMPKVSFEKFPGVIQSAFDRYWQRRYRKEELGEAGKERQLREKLQGDLIQAQREGRTEEIEAAQRRLDQQIEREKNLAILEKDWRRMEAGGEAIRLAEEAEKQRNWEAEQNRLTRENEQKLMGLRTTLGGEGKDRNIFDFLYGLQGDADAYVRRIVSSPEMRDTKNDQGYKLFKFEFSKARITSDQYYKMIQDMENFARYTRTQVGLWAIDKGKTWGLKEDEVRNYFPGEYFEEFDLRGYGAEIPKPKPEIKPVPSETKAMLERYHGPPSTYIPVDWTKAGKTITGVGEKILGGIGQTAEAATEKLKKYYKMLLGR